MPTTDLIGPQPQVTPTGETSRKRRTLPPDLLREASHRVSVMSLLGGALWVIGVGADHLAMRGLGVPGWARPDVDDVIGLAVIFLSLMLYLYSRKKDRDPEFVLNLGLGYMVLTAVGLGIMMHWDHIPANTEIFPMLSWIGAVVLMFAAILPTTPWKMFIAGFIAVSMNPVGMLIQRARGNWDFGTGTVALMHYPDYILLGVAVVISRVINRLSQQVVKAREMGSYQLNELIGQGGMGEVYKATHRMLARPAAIKLIRADKIGDLGNRELVIRRFRREAEAAANLQSPHTVGLYDFGVTDDGTFYFVMELLVGMDLESLVREYGPVPPARVIHILRQVCESLEEAHAAGLVHRDIKPANIHLGRLALRYDFVKVLDFGLVKAIEPENTGHSLETAAGRTPGTPAYMAPEMAMGEAVDGRADLYALGCVAYYLLTAKLVFNAETPLQLIARHLQHDPIPPSERTGVPLPGGLESVVMACLAKRPQDRPESARKLSELLAAIDVEPWSERQAEAWWEQNAK